MEGNTKAPIIAAIDVGTNSFHLVVATVNERGMMQTLNREKESVRLGSGSGDMKYISPEAMDRGVRAMEHFAALAQSQTAEVRAVATSATREAMNKDEFLHRVESSTGIPIEVVSGAEEGRLTYIGVIHALPIVEKQTLVMDIGGGSTETTIGHRGEVKFVASEKLGAIRLSQKFFTSTKFTRSQVSDCRDFIRGSWSPVLDRVKEVGFDTVAGTAGTITNIAAIAIAIRGDTTPEVMNGVVVKRRDLKAAINTIVKAQTVKQKQSIPGMDPGRADIITAGALILDYAIDHLDIESIIISGYALKEGIVFDTIQKKKDTNEFRHLTHLRYSTIREMCSLYRVDMRHAEFVRNTTLKLFDTLQPLHGLGPAARELLESAALLHDVGYMVSHDQHHKHSYYVILNSMMPGFTNDESEIIANIARYHRKSHPKRKHENFVKLSEERQRIVRILAGFLRIAEGIDRRQQQTVERIDIEMPDDHEINLFLVPKDNEVWPDIELWGANRRKFLMEEALNREIQIFIRSNTKNS